MPTGNVLSPRTASLAALSDPCRCCVRLTLVARRCPPCRGFTPRLAQAYRKIRSAGKKFEIVFMSSDKSEVQFGNYLTEMPWLALPFGQRELVQTLSKMFGVNGIPALILLDGDTGEVISKNGRSASLTCCGVVVVAGAEVCSKQDGACSYVGGKKSACAVAAGKGKARPRAPGTA